MKTVFDIGNHVAQSEDGILILEAGHHHCCLAAYDADRQAFGRMLYLQHESWEAESCFSFITSQAATSKSRQVIIASAYPEALAVPREISAQGNALLSTLYRLPAQVSLSSSVESWNLDVAYCIPEYTEQLALRHFDNVSFTHNYAALLNQLDTSAGRSRMLVRFSGQEFTLLAIKDEQLLLVQTYRYTSPLDVVYYLLKICYEFNLTQNETEVELSGLVEKDSALYVELSQYFVQLQFGNTPETLPGESNLPAYYFQPFYNIALCAS